MRVFLPVLLVSAALAQDVGPSTERVLRYPNVASDQDLNELAMTIRTTAEIRDVSVNSAQKTITLTTTASRAAIAEWMFNELKQPATAGEHEMKIAPDDIVRVIYFTHAQSVKEVQEAAVGIRTTGAITRLFVYAPTQAFLVRGTRQQIDLAAWMVEGLDKPASLQKSASPDFTIPGPENENTVRLFYFPNTMSPEDLNRLAVKMRTTAKVQRLFALSSPRAIAARGTPTQMAALEQMAKD